MDTGAYRRDEPEAERLDRNYNELLQELRVAQTGVQVFFAFLLSIPFQARFAMITDFQRTLYVLTLVAAALAALLFIAPVPVHRALFRQHRKDRLVVLTGRFATVGLAALLIAMLCAVLLVLDFVSSPALAWTVTTLLAVATVGLWYVLPLRMRAEPPTADEVSQPG